MDRTVLLMAAVLGFTGVAAGAFGAHGLKTRVAPELLAVFETGARYQLFHAAALVGMAALPGLSPAWVRAAGWLFAGGVVVFSGSLYVLTLTGVRAWGAVTPIGGLLLLAGWAALAVASLR